MLSWLRTRRPASPPPAIVESAVARGTAAAQAGDLDGAEHAFRQALDTTPEDPGAWMGMGNVLLARGQPAEALPFQRRALDLSPDFAVARMNAVQCLRALARHDEALAECHVLMGKRPDDPGAAALLARTLADAGRAVEACEAYEKALRLAPADPTLWCDYGETLKALHRSARAEDAYRRALEIEPGQAAALNNLGLFLYEADRLEEAESLLMQATTATSPLPQAWANLANLRVAQNRIDEALASSDRAGAAGLDTPELHFSRAMTLLVAGRIAEGFAEYEHRFGTRLYAGMSRAGPGRLWRGESLAGKRILVWPEQGLGDTLQFVRYVPALKALGADVVIEAQPPLVRLLVASLSVEVMPPGVPVEADFHCPLMSLPHRLGTDANSIPWSGPYLVAPKRPLPEALAALPRPRVGLVWAGNPAHLNDANRSVPFSDLAPLLAVPGVGFCALQFGAARDAAAGLSGVCWIDLTPEIEDFADTATMLEGLDLLVTVDTSIAHLAGAVGRPAWVLLPHSPDWRWQLGRGDTPWYPSLELLRQPARHQWAPVLLETARRLANRPL